MAKIWDKISEMAEFAEKYIDDYKENFGDDGGIWVEFEKIADIHISVLEIYDSNGLSGTFQAIAYPLDGKGNTITDSSYIQLF